MRWLVLLLFCLPAYAADLAPIEPEVSVGYGHIQGIGDGIWYQTGTGPYSLNVDRGAAKVGVLYPFGRFFELHVDVVDQGQYTTASLDTTDVNYNAKTHACLSKPCQPLANFYTTGSFPGVEFTVEFIADAFPLNKLRIPYEISTGPWLFRPSQTGYTSTVSGYSAVGTVYRFSNNPNTHLGWTLGTGLYFGQWQLSIQEFFMCLNNRCRSENFAPYERNSTVLWLTWTPKRRY